MGEGSGRYSRNLWLEFEEEQMYEEKVANAPDKIAVQQHNEAAHDTW